MKKIQKEVVTYKNVWVANDGTEFTTEEECRKYDESAKGVLMAKYAQHLVKESDEDAIFRAGSDERPVEIIFVENHEVADILLQLFLLEQPYYKNEDHKESFAKITREVHDAIGDYMLIGRGYEYDCFWFYGSRKSIIENFEKNFEDLKK